MSSEVPVAVVDVLASLLEAEQTSIFRFMEEGSVYLDRISVDARRLLQAMVAASHRRAGEIAALIESLGGVPLRRAVQPEEQYLAFLSIKFLLPKLVGAKELMIQRHENALKAIQRAAPAPAPGVVAVLEEHLAQQRQEIELLRQADAANR